MSPQPFRREALLRICAISAVLLSIVLTVAGCGGKEEPKPTAAEPIRVRAPEDDPLLKPRGSILAQEPGQNVNRVALVVNGEIVTMHELRMHTMAEVSRRGVKPGDPQIAEIETGVLDSIINDILLRQEAKRFQLSVSNAEIEDEVQRAMQQNAMSADQFETMLKRQGISMEMFRKRMADNLLRQRISSFMISRKIFVTEEEIKNYYDANKPSMVAEQNVDFSLLLIPENRNIQDIYGRMKKGALSFEDAAKEYSEDRSAKDGGHIRGVPWARMLPEMKKLLESLKDGQMTPVMRTRGGYVVIRRDAIHPERALSFEEAKPMIDNKLREPLLEERFKEYTAQLRSKAVIDIRF